MQLDISRADWNWNGRTIGELPALSNKPDMLQLDPPQSMLQNLDMQVQGCQNVTQ